MGISPPYPGALSSLATILSFFSGEALIRLLSAESSPGSISGAVGTHAISPAAPKPSPSPPSAIAATPRATPAPPKMTAAPVAMALDSLSSASTLSLPSLSPNLVSSLSPTSTLVESIDVIGCRSVSCKCESFAGDGSPSMAPRDTLISRSSASSALMLICPSSSSSPPTSLPAREIAGDTSTLVSSGGSALVSSPSSALTPFVR